MKYYSLFSSAILWTVVSLSNCQRFASDPPISDSSKETAEVTMGNARQEWIKIDQDLKSAMGKIIRRAMPALMKEIYKKEISAPCMGSLMAFAQALRQTKLWAFQILDSSGRFPEGFLHGTLTSLGNYQECVNIDVNEAKVKLQGQYCMVNLIPAMPTWKPFSSAHLTRPEVANISGPDTVITYLMGIVHNLHVTTVKVGVCTPSKCSLEDINKLASIVPEQLGLNWQFRIDHCDTKATPQLTNAQFTVLYIIGVAALLVFVGTVVDKIWSSEEMENSSAKSMLFHVIKSFSFTSNAKKLSNFTTPEPELNFINGIVFFVLCWSVIANTFMYVNYDAASNFIEALNILQHLFYEIALNRLIPLQALFYFSGFVTAYRCLKSSEQGFNAVKFLIKKFWRYTPAYGLVICLIIITPTWGSGPSWYSHMNPVYRNCKDNWWYNILYINNFMDADEVCLDHTWVFAVAAQLHIIAIFILIPLKHRPKLGLIVNFMLCASSLASVALTNVYYDLPPNEMAAMLHSKDRNFYAKHSYYRVYTHMGLYCTGVFVAYLMAKHPNIKISTPMSCFLWLFTGAGLLSALCTVHEWRTGIIPSPLLSALYTTLSKVAEASFLAWLTVAFMTGHSGGVKDVLGWRPFAFFARLTFIAYLMHVPILNMVMNFKKSQVFICELEIFYIVLSHAAGSYLISYVLHMFFEAPWLSLTDLLRRRTSCRTFNKKSSLKEPITEKPVKYSEKMADRNTTYVNNIEKGTNK